MIIRKTETGEYKVVSQDGTGRVLHTATTNAGEPISPAEKRAEWITDKIINGGAA